jgi:hypothetical protein
MARPVSGHLIMTTPILLLLRSWIFLRREKVASPSAGTRPSHGERLFQPIPAGCKGSTKN